MKDISELLKPRFRVIADWPNMPIDLKVGEILMEGIVNGKLCWRHVQRGDNGYKSTVATVHGPEFYPHLFKELAWFEEREIGDLPEYVKWHNDSWDAPTNANAVIEKVEHVDVLKDGRLFIKTKSLKASISVDCFLPATKSDFEAQKKDREINK